MALLIFVLWLNQKFKNNYILNLVSVHKVSRFCFLTILVRQLLTIQECQEKIKKNHSFSFFPRKFNSQLILNKKNLSLGQDQVKSHIAHHFNLLSLPCGKKKTHPHSFLPLYPVWWQRANGDQSRPSVLLTVRQTYSLAGVGIESKQAIEACQKNNSL